MAFNLRGFVSGHKVLVGVALLIALLTGWWRYEFPSATWRYKMTVTVETPEGLKTGYAVREVHQYTDIKIGDAGGGKAGAIGEAVVVDLGKRGVLFLLLSEDYAHNVVFHVFPFNGANTPEGMKYYSSLKNVQKSIRNYLPTMVTFKDLNNPMTVRAVDADNLEKVFGEGVHLKDALIEMTDEPVSWTIYNYLPWLESLNGDYLDGKTTSSGAPMGLYGGLFQYKGAK